MIDIAKTIIMKLPSHFIDVINISTNNLLIDYQIEKVDLSFFGKILQLNNWLTFKDWLEVYEKLNSIFEDYELKRETVNSPKENVSDFLKDFQSESFKISNKSIRVSVTKMKFDPSLAEIYSAYDCKFHNFMLHVLICVEKSLESVEYDPAKKVPDNKYSTYKKLAVTTEEEPYFPESIKSKAEQLSPDLFLETQSGHESIPVYKPSPILTGRKKNNEKQKSRKQRLFENTSLQQRETRSKRKLDMNQNCHEKKLETNQQETEIENYIRGKKLSKRKIFGSNTSFPRLESEENSKQVEDIDHCKLDITTSKLSFKPIKKKKHLSSSNVIDPVIYKNKPNKFISEDVRRIKKEIYEKDIKAINELHDVIKCALKPKKDVELKTLNHLPISYVISTFSKHEKILDNHFKKFKQSKYRYIPKIEDLDYMAIQNFISEEHLLKMCSFLKEKYESNDGFPQFTDFYMKFLIPEWVLSIFMEEYSMNRKDALQQILDQEESNLCSSQMIDTTLLNISK